MRRSAYSVNNTIHSVIIIIIIIYKKKKKKKGILTLPHTRAHTHTPVGTHSKLTLYIC